MARVKRGVPAHARHKKVLGLAKGYRGRAKSSFRIAIEKVEKGLRYAYRDRRTKSRDYCVLWTLWTNAGAREHGLTYWQFIAVVKIAGLGLDCQVLADLAARVPDALRALVDTAMRALAK